MGWNGQSHQELEWELFQERKELERKFRRELERKFGRWRQR